MKRKGRPILGAISGLLFGLFIALDLHMFNVASISNSAVAIGLPIAGMLLGIAIAMWAPRGRNKEPKVIEPV